MGNTKFINNTVNALRLKANHEMSFGSKLKENIGMLLVAVFYAIAGILGLVEFYIANFPPHLAIMGILSILAAYGVFQKRAWSFWLVAIMFFVATTFSAYQLYYTIGKDLLLNVTLAGYIVLTWIATICMITRRKKLQS